MPITSMQYSACAITVSSVCGTPTSVVVYGAASIPITPPVSATARSSSSVFNFISG